MSDVEARLAALEADVAALKAGADAVVAPIGDVPDELVAAVHAHLRSLGLEPHRTQSLGSDNVINMLRATGGDAALAAGNFFADVLRFRSRGEENLRAQGVKNPSDADILDRAAYLLWVGLHDQGGNAVAVAQGFPDSLGGL